MNLNLITRLEDESGHVTAADLKLMILLFNQKKSILTFSTQFTANI